MGKTQQNANWILINCTSEWENESHRLDLPSCIVGRSESAGLRVNDHSISKSHARFFVKDDRLFVQDLDSTNGTFVNGDQIHNAAVVVKEGDLIQFASHVFRLETQSEHDDEIERTLEEVPFDWANRLLNFERLMSERIVTPLYQPIVQIDAGTKPFGFEMLACSSLEHLETAADVFGTAEFLNQQAALSELLREEGALVASTSKHNDQHFFFNIDPLEFGTARLIESLTRLRESYPNMRFTLEVHEKSITRMNVLRAFRQTLKSLDIQLAYDDFGAGQGRLLELTEVAADVVKFDMRLIRGINEASNARQELLRSLVKAARNCGSLTLAECVETQAEHDTCVQLGFQLGQGFFYGRPQPIEH